MVQLWVRLSGDLGTIESILGWRRTISLCLLLIRLNNGRLLTQELSHLRPLSILPNRWLHRFIAATRSDGVSRVGWLVVFLLGDVGWAFWCSYSNSTRNILSLGQPILRFKVILDSLVLILEHGFHQSLSKSSVGRSIPNWTNRGPLILSRLARLPWKLSRYLTGGPFTIWRHSSGRAFPLTWCPGWDFSAKGFVVEYFFLEVGIHISRTTLAMETSIDSRRNIPWRFPWLTILSLSTLCSKMFVEFVVDVLLEELFKLLLMGLHRNWLVTQLLLHHHLLLDILALSYLELRSMNSILLLILGTDWNRDLIFHRCGRLLLIKVIYLHIFRILNLLIVVLENKVSEFCS